MQQQTIDVMDTEVNWKIIAQLFDKITETHWALMQHQRESKSSDWINLRFCILGSVRRKRSYDFAWSSKEQRLARVEGSFRLQSEFPDLHRCLIKYLSKSTEPLQDTAAKGDRVSNVMEALERLRTSNIFDRATWRTRGYGGTSMYTFEESIHSSIMAVSVIICPTEVTADQYSKQTPIVTGLDNL